jgi:proton-translocating NADH-quinone oxidoreductase chain N
MASLFILLPFLGLLVVNLPFGASLRRVVAWLAAGVALGQALFVLFQPPGFWNGPTTLLDSVLPLHLQADSLSQVLLLAIGLVALGSLAIGNASLKLVDERVLFSNVVLLAMLGMNGTVLVTDLFSLWVFIEMVGVCSFVLIGFHKDADGLEGSLKYLILSAVASILMLVAIALVFMHTGDVGFEAVHKAIGTKGAPWSLLPFGLFLGGLMIKGGLVPFHGWLPDAYTAAPASVSVLLAGVVTKTSGIYTLIRLVTSVFGFSETLRTTLLVVGALSILIGAFAAIGQKDMKRMLAWSSISQVGYIVLALGGGTQLAIAGATFHLFNHSIFKAQLFMNAAAVEEQTGTRDMDKLGGISSKMPLTSWSSVVAFLSTAGVPPLAGFWSKLVIVIALWTAGYHFFAVIAVVASLITLAYFLSMQRRVFFGQVREGLENLREAHAGYTVPAVAFAVITVCVGVFFFYLLNTFILPVQSLVG